MKKGTQREVIKSIHYKEVQNFLDFIRRHEKLEEEIICCICKDKITVQNFKAMIRLSEKFLFCCNKPECYRTFIETLRR